MHLKLNDHRANKSDREGASPFAGCVHTHTHTHLDTGAVFS